MAVEAGKGYCLNDTDGSGCGLDLSGQALDFGSEAGLTDMQVSR